MKTDLAPKFLYYWTLILIGVMLISIGIVHQRTMWIALNQKEYIPFFVTSVMATGLMLSIVFILNKCRYLVINPADEEKFIMGNLLTQTHSSVNQLTIAKRVAKNFYKIIVEGKNYYMFSYDEMVTDFVRNKN